MTVKRSNVPGDMNLSDTVRYWLSSWDFVDNPFALWQAGDEPWLERYFIRPPFYEQLLTGSKSTLVFAPRGGGKTAMRIMLENECRPVLSFAPVLAASFTDFSPLAESLVYAPQFTLADYLPHMIAAIMPRLLTALLVNTAAAEIFSATEFGKLRYWIDRYTPYILNSDQLRVLLYQVDSGLDEETLSLLISSIERGRPSPKGVKTRLAAITHWLSILRSTSPITPDVPIDSPSRIMKTFVKLAIQVLSYSPTPCRMLFLLVDGIDEYSLTQDSPESSAELLRPLLGNLRFLELPSLVIKFFLPVEHRAALEQVARIDRLDVIFLTWKQAKGENHPDYLRDLLRRRIAAFNTRGLHTLGEMCDPSLRHWLEDAMLEEADGSPRNLMRLGNFLFAEHCREMPSPESVILPVEWERAVVRFRGTVHNWDINDLVPSAPVPVSAFISSSGVPPLRIDLKSGKVYRGVEKLLLLSELEYRLLSFLYRHKGRVCTKDEIILAVYEPKYDGKTHSATQFNQRDKKLKDAEEAAIARLFNRLRKKVEMEPSKPVYVITLKGRGYRLDNAE